MSPKSIPIVDPVRRRGRVAQARRELCAVDGSGRARGRVDGGAACGRGRRRRGRADRRHEGPRVRPGETDHLIHLDSLQDKDENKN